MCVLSTVIPFPGNVLQVLESVNDHRATKNERSYCMPDFSL